MKTTVTKEIHALVREKIEADKKATNKDIAFETGVSNKTVSRIRRGGRTIAGYRKSLQLDHPKTNYRQIDGMPDYEDSRGRIKARVLTAKPSMLNRIFGFGKRD